MQHYTSSKIEIGVDSQTGLVHSARVTSVNVHESKALSNLSSYAA